MKDKSIICKTRLLLACLLTLLSCVMLLALGTLAVYADAPAVNAEQDAGAEAVASYAGGAHTATETYLPLTQAVLDGMRKSNLDDTYYEIPAGSYRLSEDLTAEYNILITDSVDICLDGYTLSMAPQMGIRHLNGIVNICDCSADGTGKISLDNSDIGIVVGEPALEDKVETVFNLYSGELTNTHSLGGGIRVYHSDINIYGGTVRGKNDFALEVYGQSRVNIHGGTVNSVSFLAVGLYVHELVAPTLCMDGGEVIGYTYGVYGQSATVDMQGGTVEGYNAGMHLVLGSEASFTGGTLRAKGKASTDAGLRIENKCRIKLSALTVESKAYGIYTGIDAAVTIDPASDTAVRVTATTAALYMKDGQVDNKGKVVINGGTFTNSSTDSNPCVLMKAGTLEINGGVFQSKGMSVDINPDYWANAYLTVKGNPTFNGRIRLWRVGTNQNGAYYGDFSGYTGEGLSIVLVTSSVKLANDLLVAKGSADKLTVSNTGWMLVDGTDTAMPANAVVKLTCAGHTGGEPTCVTPASCATCGASYTLPHTFGEWIAETPATCSTPGTAAHKDCPTCGRHFGETGEALTDLTIPLDPGAHKWGDWTQTTAPTCTAEGEETRTCAHDQAHTETRRISALGHSFGKEYLHDESKHWHTCSRCGETDASIAHSLEGDGCVCGYRQPASSGCGAAVSMASVMLLLLAGCVACLCLRQRKRAYGR